MRRISQGKHQALRRTGMQTLRAAVALPFLIAGAVKLVGLSGMVSLFHEIGLGQWFRYMTGGLEVVGGVLVFTRRWVLGALILCCVAAGAIVTHVTKIGGSPVPATILLAMSVALAAIGIRRYVREAEGHR